MVIDEQEDSSASTSRAASSSSYQGRATPQQPTVDADAIDRAIDRSAAAATSSASPRSRSHASGTDQILVGIPGAPAVGKATSVGTKPARLYFYDWEANVIAQDPVSQRRAAPRTRSPRLYDAVKLASKQKPTARSRQRAAARPTPVTTFQRQPPHDHIAGPETAAAISTCARTAEAPPAPGRSSRCRRERWWSPTPRTRTGDLRPATVLLGDATTSPRFRAATSRTRSRTTTRRPTRRTSPSTSPIPARRSSRTSPARSPSAGPANATCRAHEPGVQLRPLRDHPRQRGRLAADHQLLGEPRRHRRPTPAPRSLALNNLGEAQDLAEYPEERCAADRPQADQPEPGLGDARQAGARPGPEGWDRRLLIVV